MPYRDHDDVSVLRVRHGELVRDLQDVEARLSARRAIALRATLGVGLGVVVVIGSVLALSAIALRPRGCTRPAGAGAARIRDAVEMYCVEHPAAVCPTFDDLVDERIVSATDPASARFVIVCEHGRCAGRPSIPTRAAVPSRSARARGTP